MTRMPLVSDSATFSAGWRHTEQFRNMASPSFHSPVARSNVRGVEATVKFATGAPDGVKRSSGSAVRLPTSVMEVSPAMLVSPIQSDVLDESFTSLSGPTDNKKAFPAIWGQAHLCRSGRMTFVRMICSFRVYWRSSSLTTAGSAVTLSTA